MIRLVRVRRIVRRIDELGPTDISGFALVRRTPTTDDDRRPRRLP
jgi:hypothetical protein